MDNNHAHFAPSFAPVWVHCPGAAKAAAELPPQEDSDASRLGTAAHWALSTVLESYTHERGLVMAESLLNARAPNGVAIDQEVIDCISVMISDVLQVCTQYGGLNRLMIEKRVHMPRIHPDNWGTLDAALVLPEVKKIFIWDYKHGHRLREAFHNWQLIDYLEGIAETVDINGHDDQLYEVDARIVQPRAYSSRGPISSWRFKLAELRPHWNALQQAAWAEPTLTTGPHCRDCPALLRCPAARAKSYAMVDFVEQPYGLDTLTGEALAAQYDILEQGFKVYEKRLEAVKAELAHRIKSGEVTGYVAESTYSALKWDVKNDEVVLLGQMFGIDAEKDLVCTPTQLLDRAGPDIKPALSQILQSYASRRTTGTKLTKATATKAAKIFNQKGNQL